MVGLGVGVFYLDGMGVFYFDDELFASGLAHKTQDPIKAVKENAPAITQSKPTRSKPCVILA